MSSDGRWTEMLATALTPLQPATETRTQWLARLRGPERFTLFAGDVARLFGVSRLDALDALRMIHRDEAWVPGQLFGSRLLTTPALTAQRTVISQLPAGVCLPKHSHAIRELTFVLDGCLIENGVARRTTAAVLDMPIGSEHALQVSDDEPCLVVFSNL
jgi:hypothetical protein